MACFTRRGCRCPIMSARTKIDHRSLKIISGGWQEEIGCSLLCFRGNSRIAVCYICTRVDSQLGRGSIVYAPIVGRLIRESGDCAPLQPNSSFIEMAISAPNTVGIPTRIAKLHIVSHQVYVGLVGCRAGGGIGRGIAVCRVIPPAVYGRCGIVSGGTAVD